MYNLKVTIDPGENGADSPVDVSRIFPLFHAAENGGAAVFSMDFTK